MAPSPTIRRLLKETSELSSSSKNPNPAFHAAPVSDTDLHEWHFTLLGPPSPSPYAGGLYHGRISLPPSYPLKPPNFRFLTPSGRFEVNREICLSISGFHEETWMPAWGVRTALTALRSFMAESGTAGQVGGLESPKEVRERLAKESRSWSCSECGCRSNGDIMKSWWEACAEKGVKVGEDVGLEVLPEGLSLEAKTPAGAAAAAAAAATPAAAAVDREVKQQGADGAQARHEEEVAATTQAILHNKTPISSSSSLSPPTTTPITRTTRPRPGSLPSIARPLPPPQSPSPPNEDDPSVISTRRPIALPLPTPTSTEPPHHQYQHHSSPSSSSSTTTNTNTSRVQPPTQLPPGLRPLPVARPPSFLTRRRQQPSSSSTTTTTSQTQSDQGTHSLDRAIYIIFLALCLMILKKLFYPATNSNDWEEFGMIKE